MSDYLILAKDITVAKWENNHLTVLDEQMLPLFLKRVANADYSFLFSPPVVVIVLFSVFRLIVKTVFLIGCMKVIF